MNQLKDIQANVDATVTSLLAIGANERDVLINFELKLERAQDIMRQVKNALNLDHGLRAELISTEQAIVLKEAIEYICNPYYQVEFKDDRRYDGTGLGLALAKMILDKHNAPLVITSEPDIGSTFSFSLPLANLE